MCVVCVVCECVYCVSVRVAKIRIVTSIQYHETIKILDLVFLEDVTWDRM